MSTSTSTRLHPLKSAHVMLFAWLLLVSCFDLSARSSDPTLSGSLAAYPEQVAQVKEENSAYHPLLKYFQPASGQWTFATTDLKVTGAQPLELQRILLSPHIAESYHKKTKWDLFYLHGQLARPGNGWTFLPELFMQAREEQNKKICYVTEATGVTLAFCLDASTGKFSLDMDPYGMHNGLEHPGSTNDYRNSTLHFDKATGYFVFTTSEGVQRFYKFPKTFFSIFRENAKGCLEKTILRSGMVVRYHYANGQIAALKSFDPSEQHLYAKLCFSQETESLDDELKVKAKKPKFYFKPEKSLSTTVCTGNTGNSATWQEEILSGPIKLTTKGKHGKHTWKHSLPSVRLLRNSHSPLNGDASFSYASRFVCSDIHVKEGNLRAEYALFGTEPNRHYRIKTLFRKNEEGSYIPLYNFDYTLPEIGKSGGSTRITLHDASQIDYQINANMMVDRICWKDPSGKTRKEERFIWNAKQWCERKELYADGKLVRSVSYTYDERGNPIQEELTGDLTGNGSIVKSCIRRTFSQDALALLLSEEKDNGRVDCYSYLPGTDLLQSHFIQNKNCICRRTFFIYNAQNLLIEKRIDDGSGSQRECLDDVTEAHITCWKLRGQAPFLHLPEEKQDYVLDQGKRECVGRSCYTYDTEGNIATQQHYDGCGQLLDTLSRVYNAGGDVVSETNHLGQTCTYAYDAYGRKTEEAPFSGDRKIRWFWDNQGRCISKIITGSDGLETHFAFSYNLYDAPIREMGPHGEVTEREYDFLSGKLTKIQEPSTLSLSKTGHAVATWYVYDGIGRLVAQKNPNGSVTKTSYTAHGKPHTITHADGTQEHFLYSPDGHLERYTDREGCQIHYTWDIWDHVIAKSYTDAQGNMLAQESWEYNPFHLLRKVDKEGHITTYTYDLQGRKVEEDATPRLTRFKYDARGDVKEIIYVGEVDKDNSLHVHMQRDSLGRVIETHYKEPQGNLLKWEGVTYDPAGRIATQEYLHDGQRITESFTYDSKDRLIRHVDSLGAITTTEYGEKTHRIESRTHRIETKRVTSPEGEVTEVWYDHAGRQWVCDLWDSQLKQLLRRENVYDPEGNLLYHHEWLYDDQAKASLHTVARTYTQDNLVASLTRAAGTDLARTTTYTYSPAGRLITRQNPSGSLLHYTYDGLGFLRSMHSSDQTVDQHLEVNRLGDLIKSVDGTTGLELHRKVDRFGSILSECFPHGKQMHREYDAQGRLIELEVTGLGSTHYSYDSLFLRSIEKFSVEGKSIALHRYTDYDLKGALKSELWAGGLGSLKMCKDAKGRLLEMHTPHGTTKQVFDTQDRLISRTEEGHGLTSLQTAYTYDGLSQLLSEQSEQDTDTQSYQYDMQGCRLSKNGAHSEVNPLCEELSNGTHQFAYDLDGNRIEKTDLQSGLTWTYAYNALHQCTEASCQTTRVQFAYDALHRKSRRIVQQREDTTQPWTEVDRLYFLYQGGEEVGSYLETGECTSYRVLAYPEDSALPRTVYMELEGNWYVPQIDAQGSITHLLDPRTAAVASLTRHTAFGEVRLNGFLPQSSEANVSSMSSPWGYFSKRLDPELGLIDFGRRWYDPQQARWTTLDPAGFIDGTNLYRFVKNNPLLYTDPDGRFAVVIPILSAAGWITAKGVLYALGAAAAGYGAYRVGDYFVNDFLNRYERPEEMAWIMGHGPVFSTTTEYEPAPPTGGEKGPELNNGPGQSPIGPVVGAAVGYATTEVIEETKEVIKKGIYRSARRALVRLLREDPPDKDAHHIFPRKHRKDFEKRGIDIDNPNYLTFWERTSHQKAARAYNLKWEKFFRDNPGATEAQILNEGKSMVKEYDIPTHY